MTSTKYKTAFSLVLFLFSFAIVAQNSFTENNSKCYPNYVYVQGASNKVAFLNKSTCDYSFCEWNFGDGKTALSTNAVHEYSSPGYYLLCLIVGNPGQNDTLYQIINVHNNADYSPYANVGDASKDSFVLSARSKSALFDCFDKFFEDAVLVSGKGNAKKQAAERNW